MIQSMGKTIISQWEQNKVNWKGGNFNVGLN